MIPGEYQIKSGDIELCEGRPTISVHVSNTGDRPIQIGSHYHFYETNNALDFDREKPTVIAWRFRLVPQHVLNPVRAVR